MSDSYIQAVEKNIDAAGERTDEITRLREENAQLVDILDDVLAQWDGDWPEELYARVKAAIREEQK